MWSRAAALAAAPAGSPAARSRSSRTSRPPSAMLRRSSATPSRPRTRATGSARPRGHANSRACGLACGSPMSAPARAIIRCGCARVVGAKGRVLAEDIMPEVTDQLRRARPAGAARQCRGKAWHAGRPRCSRRIRSTGSSSFTCTTRSNRPTPSCGTCAKDVKPDGLVVVVDAEKAGGASRHAARATQMRVRCAESRTGEIRDADRAAKLISWPSGSAVRVPPRAQSTPAMPKDNRPAHAGAFGVGED